MFSTETLSEASKTWSWMKDHVFNVKVLNGFQTGLDAAGLFPGFGEIADGINGLIYTARGDTLNAALSYSAMIPIVGNASTAGKWINKGADAVDEVSDAVGKTNKSVNDDVTGKGGGDPDLIEVEISRNKYPESTKHIEDAIANGQPEVLTIDRSGSKANRKASLKGIDKVPGKDLDEYPPAMFKEGGDGASVRPINPSDNRGSGSTFGHKLRPYPNGTKVKYKITDD
ncbi:NucA/NucB deoxyribonuclease domain-containing protein [Lysinibacillus sp. 54212]|uniref:NucA/NucB deoxyribonuclease domain-containing protein n=1 Tax=Lysinibacillus sp. 54212 TaxID=3119829 RepID=UPI002FCA5304